jgi:hypothetical protein
MKTFLTAIISLLVGLAARFWLGRSWQPKENCPPAFEADLTATEAL